MSGKVFGIEAQPIDAELAPHIQNAIMAEILAFCNSNISNVLHAQLEKAKNPKSAIMELLKCEESFRLSFREIVLNDQNSPLNIEEKNATSEAYRLKLTAMQTGYTRWIENITQKTPDVSSTQIRKALDMSFNQRMIYFVLRETVRDARDNIVKLLTARFKNEEVLNNIGLSVVGKEILWV